jgi:hypothetical protein
MMQPIKLLLEVTCLAVESKSDLIACLVTQSTQFLPDPHIPISILQQA